MSIVDLFFRLLDVSVMTVILALIVLMLIRLIINYADPNPFSRPVAVLRQFTDPPIAPARGWLLRSGINPSIAPLITILLAIVLGYFVLQLADSLHNTINRVIDAGQNGSAVKVIGSLLYGAVDLYSLLMLIYIIVSWGGRNNRLVRFLARFCEPVLAPLRRIIPPLGMFDLSPLILFLFIFPLLKAAIARVLLS